MQQECVQEKIISESGRERARQCSEWSILRWSWAESPLSPKLGATLPWVEAL